MPRANAYTTTLDQVDAQSLPQVGGKGANLGELIRAGLPVPEAFCVTTKAYKDFLQANSIGDPIMRTLDGLDYDNPAEIEQRASAIREMIVEAQTPSQIADAIQDSYAHLESTLGKDVLVAVRSSATAEDLPGTSFAGQQDTYLNVHGADNVLIHVKRCWASLWTDRAISYRHRQGFRHEDVLLAVVVQEMFPSEVAGVMFTANPVTSNPGEIFLNTSWGLGEAIVSGKVNPDQYIVDKEPLSIRDKKIHDKRVMTVRHDSEQGSLEVEVPADKRTAETLPEEQVLELAKIAVRIEEHYGFPQDIEWGYSNGRFAILQAREVTAADIDFGTELEVWKSTVALDDMFNEKWLWSRAYSDEVQTGPSTPFFYTRLQNGMTHGYIRSLHLTGVEELLGYTSSNFEDMPLFRWYGARAYYNLAYVREKIRLFIPPFARDDSLVWPFPEEQREEIKNMPFNWPRFVWLMVKLHITEPDISLIETPYHCFQNLPEANDRIAAYFDAMDFKEASAREMLEGEVAATPPGAFEFGRNVNLAFRFYLYILPAALRKLCELWLADDQGELYSHLVAGLHTKTTEENIAIWKLSRRIKSSAGFTDFVLTAKSSSDILKSLDDTEDGRAFKAELEEFLRVYGHRGGAERDPYHPRWHHKPEMVFHSIIPMLSLDDENDPEALEERLHERMLATRSRCVSLLRREPLLGYWKAMFFEWFVKLTQDYFNYRDFERFYNDRNMARPRDYLKVLAERFSERGLMSGDWEDIFFLGKEEIIDADEGRLNATDIEMRVRSRRRVYERYTNKEPPKYIRGWETFDDDQVVGDGNELRGIGASGGVVSGRARVCRKLDEISKVEKGDILITVATDPGWTTVFSIISGVVVETGGVVAHAVMISREYGLPCVANLYQACDLIPDGQMITVDGNAGRVLIHDEPV